MPFECGTIKELKHILLLNFTAVKRFYGFCFPNRTPQVKEVERTAEEESSSRLIGSGKQASASQDTSFVVASSYLYLPSGCISSRVLLPSLLAR